MRQTHPAHTPASRAGFSLIEVVIAVSIFGFLGLTVSSTALYARYQAEKNIYRNMAATATLGYAEQIKNMTYAKLQTSLSDPDIPLPAVSVQAVIKGEFGNLDDPLFVGPNNINKKQVLIDIENPNEEDEKQILMEYELLVLLNDLAAVNGMTATEVTLRYRYRMPHGGGYVWRDDELRFLKAKGE